MWKTSWKNLWSHKRRLLGTSFAVLLGVAFLAATLVLTDTMRAGLDNAFTESMEGTDVVVRSETELGDDEGAQQRGLLDLTIVDELQSVEGVRVTAAVVEGKTQIVAPDGDLVGGDGPPTVGANWVDDPDLSGWDLIEGRGPAVDGEVVINKTAADDAGLHVGDRTTVRTPELVPVTIVGIASLGEDDAVGGLTYVAFTLEQAQEVLLGDTGKITSVALAAEPDVSQEELQARVQPTLPAGLEALTGAQVVDELNDEIESDFLGFMEKALLVFAGIALLVATFSIHNTFSILVAQRTRESALLRALGASRRQVIGSVAIESTTVGLLSSLGGLGAGVALAFGLQKAMDAGGLGIPTASMVIGTATVVAAIVTGMLVTIVASVAPAVKASRVPPLAAMRGVAIDRSSSSKIRGVVGAVVAGGGIALTFSGVDGGDGSMSRAGLGALLSLVGLVVLGPVVARPATAVLGLPVRVLRGQTGALARQNAMRNPRRTSGTASALLVGTAVVALFTVVAASLKSSIDEVVDKQFAGDLVVVEEGFSGVGIDPALAPAMDELPEVSLATGFGEAVVVVDGETEYPLVGDPVAIGELLALDVTAGALSSAGNEGLALEREYADEHGWQIGAEVPMEFADGSTEVVVVSAIYDQDTLVGELLMPREVYARHATQVTDVAVLIDLADGVAIEDGKAAAQAVADRFVAPDVLDRDEYVDSVAGEVDQTLVLVYGLLGLAIIIALLGIANTLSLSIHERTREIGLLRAVGQTRRQLRSTVRWEAVIVAVFGTLGGIALGTFLGWALFSAIAAEEGFGSFTAPVGTLAVIVVLSAVAGVLASVRPARRAARLDVLRAISVG